MEDYLQYMRTLRSHMNDAEDQADKTSVEEQMHITTIQTLQNDIDSAKSETKRLKEESDQMLKAKGQICSQILQVQKKNALLEYDISTLSQTLELIQQERVNLSTKLVEKRTCYGKTEEDINTKLKEQQDWLNSYNSTPKSGQQSLVNTQADLKANEYAGNYDAKSLATGENLDDVYKNMMKEIDAATAKLEKLTQMRSELALEHHKVRQSLEEMKRGMESFMPELRDLPSETLEEELQALMSDKGGETEYQESLLSEIDAIKGISHTVKCGCGEEYKVEVDLCV